MSKDITDGSQHFRFGENWRSFAAQMKPGALDEARIGLEKLFPNDELRGVSFLDIGCGSGLHLAAAHMLGVSNATGIDIDADSVDTTRRVLAEHLPDAKVNVRHVSVFDATTEKLGQHGVVYSWGVLHHTGNMWAAIDRAASLVAPGGLLALALYRKSPFCGVWRAEKRVYAHAPKIVQAIMSGLYKGVYKLGLRATGRSPAEYIGGYTSLRGMDWHHDVHDWLGGYPYESVTPDELAAYLIPRGFSLVRQFERPAAIKGLLGTHCDEFVWKKG